jgi:hypothetical protein
LLPEKARQFVTIVGGYSMELSFAQSEGLMQAPEITNDDLNLLRRAAVLAGATVAITRYSGVSTRDEFRAIVEGLQDAAKRYPGNALVQALVTDETRAEADGLYPQFRYDPTQRTYDDFKLVALNRCAQAAEVLKQKASPEQAAEVKTAIVSMCDYVAQSAKEGTTFGLGGTRVDPLETAAVDQIKRALEV